MSFLGLPAELRNIIYRLALVEPNDQAIEKHESYTYRNKYREPALLHVNHQIRNEAFPVFWGGNTFCFVNLTTTALWLNRLQPHKIAALRSVRSVHPNDARDWSKQISRSKEHLRDIHKSLSGKGLRLEVVKLPMQVENEVEVCWIALTDVDKFKKGSYEGFVVRKAVEDGA